MHQRGELLLTLAAAIITYASGWNYYLQSRRESSLTLAPGIMTYMTSCSIGRLANSVPPHDFCESQYTKGSMFYVEKDAPTAIPGFSES